MPQPLARLLGFGVQGAEPLLEEVGEGEQRVGGHPVVRVARMALGRDGPQLDGLGDPCRQLSLPQPQCGLGLFGLGELPVQLGQLLRAGQPRLGGRADLGDPPAGRAARQAGAQRARLQRGRQAGET